MLIKPKLLPLTLPIILTAILFSCSFFKDKTNENSQSTVPVPGSPVTATATGSTIALTWGQATDDAGAEWLMYKVVRGETPVNDVNSADLLPDVIQDYTEYSGETAYDTGVSPGVHYYNVIVKDEDSNTALYKGASAEAVLDNTPPVPGSGITAQGAGSTVKC